MSNVIAIRKNSKSEKFEITLQSLAILPRWVAWCEEVRVNKDGTEIRTKVPYDPNTGRKAQIPTQPSTWGTRTEAEKRWKKMSRANDVGGVGIVLGELDDGSCLMGIDLDGCRDPHNKGNVTEIGNDIIDRFDSYAEISPSQKGVKIFFLIKPGDVGAVMKWFDQGDDGEPKTRKSFVVGEHCEIALDRARFYTVTDRIIDDVPDTLRVVDIDDVQWLIEEAGPDFLKLHGVTGNGKGNENGGRDQSGSGHGFRFMQEHRSGIYVTVRKHILADNGPAGEWARRVDERQLRRAWDAAQKDAAQKKADGDNKVYEMVQASAIPIRPTQWLWKGHLARGAQELMAGIPGLGKSQLQCSFVGSTTTGREFPDGWRGSSAPANAIMVTGEDALDQTVVPRLMAAGANLERVFFLKAIKQDNKSRMFLLGEDLDQLEQMIKKVGDVALVCFDPITAFMGKINSSNVTDVRGQLGPLKDLAERTDVAISTVTHPPKEGSRRAIDQFIGSQAFIAAGRIGHLCVEEMGGANGDMAPTGRVLFTNPKNNLMAKMPTLAYRIEQTIVGKSHSSMEITYVDWEEQVELSADQAIAVSRGSARTTPVDEFLLDLLSTAIKGEMWTKEIVSAGAARKFSFAQLRGAKLRLGITAEKDGMLGWKWKMPSKN